MALPLIACVGWALAAGTPAAAQDTHLLIVTGLGGDPEYADTFHEWSATLRRGALEAGVRPERIAWLSEDPSRSPDAISRRSTLENVEDHLATLAPAVGPRDRILLVFIGHGTARGDEARFNLPGPDLTGRALAGLLADFPTQTVAVVNTAPASGPWVDALSGPGRVVVTATASARERNETHFGRYFAAAFRDAEADLDKDERVSLLEAFRFATSEVERHYEERNLLMTEHARLDAEEAAGRFWLTPRIDVRAGSPDADVPPGVTDPELRRLHRERADLERRVAELRELKESMEPEAYDARLEELLLELAVVSRAIREGGGSGDGGGEGEGGAGAGGRS